MLLPTIVAAVSAKATIMMTVLAITGGKNSNERIVPKIRVTGPNATPRSSILRMLDFVMRPNMGNEYPFILRHSEII